MPDLPARQKRAQWGALLAFLLVLALPASAVARELKPNWGYAYIDELAFQKPSGEHLSPTQAFPRGHIRDNFGDGHDVEITVWAFDSQGDPLYSYAVREPDGQDKAFDRWVEVAPQVIAYMRFDFCRVIGERVCVESQYIGRPDPPGPPGPPGGGSTPPASDVDADGHVAPADCDDRNSRVYPGAPEVSGNGIDDDCDGGDRPGKVTADVQNTWRVQGRRTRVARLRVRDAPQGAAVDVSCRGRGCSFKQRSFGVDASGSVPLAKLFERRLGARAAVEVRITVPNAIGKVVRFRMRRARLPAARRLCLPPGAAAPVRC